MEKKKIIDLIKLEVLGCINEKDSAALQSSKETDADFPWKELGDYQNLAALLPSALELEFPKSELKDRVAVKLYSIRDEIKTKLDAKKAAEEPLVLVEEEKQIEEEEGIQFEELSNPVKEIEVTPISVAEKAEVKRAIEDPPAKTDHRMKSFVDREMVDRAVRDYFNSNVESQMNSIRESISRNLTLSIIFFVLSLILIVISFIIG